MRQLIYVPIEPLTERYTEEWYHGFTAAFEAEGYDVHRIDGQPLVDEVQVGTFLDANSTMHYKWTQLQAISRMFHERNVLDGAIFFFSDLEFWGLEGVKLMAQMNGVEIHITGFMHAGSYTREDAFSVAAPYQQYTEVGWLAAADLIFVGSAYHKQAIIDRRLRPVQADHIADNIRVTRNPLFTQYLSVVKDPKENKLVIPNRFDREKRPQEDLELAIQVLDTFPDWKVVVTSGRSSFRGTDTVAVRMAEALSLRYPGRFEIKAGLSKAEYHREIATSKIMISHSIEENYGICIAESLHYGTIPVLREGLSHDEFEGAFTFGQEGAFPLVNTLISSGTENIHVPGPDYEGLNRILEELRNLR